MHLRSIGLTLATLALILVVACGGDSKGGILSGKPSSPAPASSPTVGPASSNSTGVGKVVKVEDTHRYLLKVEWTGPDLAGMQSLVEQVQSITGSPTSKSGSSSIEIAGAYLKPDKSTTKYTANNVSFTATTIGTQQWVQFGTTTQGPKAIRPLQFGAHAPAASFLTVVGDKPTIGLLKCSGTESVNGVTARKCGFSQGDVSPAELQSFFDSYISRQATVTVRAADVTRASVQTWISQQTDQPVKIVIELAGKESKGTAFTHRLEANVTDIGRPVDIAAPR